MSTSTEACKICAVIQNREYITLAEHGVVFHPQDSKMDGHLIVASTVHVQDALTNPVITAQVFRLAAMTASRPCVLLTQIGGEAGQTVGHLYVHIIPALEARVSITPRRK